MDPGIVSKVVSMSGKCSGGKHVFFFFQFLRARQNEKV